MTRLTSIRRYATRAKRSSKPEGPLPNLKPGFNAFTLLGDAESLIESARSLLPSFTKDASLLLYSLSRTLPREQLGAAVSLLRESSSSPILGALTDAIPGDRPSTSLHSLAVAVYRPEKGRRVVPFRSTLPGRPRIALGREVKPDLEAEREWPATQKPGSDWNDSWGAQRSAPLDLPKTLADLDPNTVSQVFVLSDDAPEGLLTSLDARFPSAVKHGIIGASTPFVTGRPFTLMQGEEVFGDGAVGFAVCHDSPLPSPLEAPKTTYHGLIPLSGALSVTDAQGNIILTLDNKPATRLLVDLINAVGDTQERKRIGDDKEVEYYLGRVDHAHTTCTTISRIVSGSPSKGVMAIDTEDSYASGQAVQLFYRPRSTALPSCQDLLRPTTQQGVQLHCLAAGEEGVPAPRADPVFSPARCLADVWSASSDNGHLAGGFLRPSRACNVIGSVSSVGLGRL